MELEAFINGDRQKRAKKRSRTLRLVVDLAPPTEDYTNEFSYTELVEGAREKVRPGDITGGSECFYCRNMLCWPCWASKACGCDGFVPLEKAGFGGRDPTRDFPALSTGTRPARGRGYAA